MSSDAAKRAAARRAKIMARGNAGLAKLAQTARGEEAQKLYGDEINAPAISTSTATSTDTAPSASASTTTSDSKPTQSTQSSQPKPTTSTSTRASDSDAGRSLTPSAAARNKPSWAADPAAASGAVTPSEAEEQARQQMEAMMAMLGGGPSGPGGPGGAGAQGEMPDMASMFAQMMQGMQGMQQPGADGEMPNPFAALQGMGGGGAGGMPPFPGMGGMGGMPGMPGMELPPSKAARRFPIVHALVIIALILFIALWWEPNLHMVRAGDLAARTVGDWSRRWSGLAGDVGNTSLVEKLPVFWAFITLEVLLFSTRTTFIRSGSGMHPLLANVVPMLPPVAQRAVRAGAKALPALMQTYRDGCLFFFGLGMAVVLAEWKAGVRN